MVNIQSNTNRAFKKTDIFCLSNSQWPSTDSHLIRLFSIGFRVSIWEPLYYTAITPAGDGGLHPHTDSLVDSQYNLYNGSRAV